MTRAEMITWLEQRYTEQTDKFPTLRTVTREQYIAVNIRSMVRSAYWKQRTADEK